MRRENTAKSIQLNGFTQFDLSKKVLNNLNNYNLKPTAKLVLLYLCDCYNPKHGEMFPKQSTIAEKLGISEVSVTRAVQELHKEGLLISERKYTNKYKFTSRIVAECPNNLIRNNNQKDSKESIKKTSLYIEQKEETKKEQISSLWGNVYSMEEYAILKKYSLRFTTEEKVDAYIAGIRKNGGDKSILKKYHQKTFITKRAKADILETKQFLLEQHNLNKTAIKPRECETWKWFGEKIKSSAQ